MQPATSHGSRCTRITRLGLILALLAVGLVGPAAPIARADTLVVENNAPSGGGSLRAAIDGADPGDTITFDPSLSGAAIYPGSPLVLDKDLTIDGSALAEPVTLSGNDAVRVMEVMTDTAVTLHGLVITHGAASDHDPEGTDDDDGGGIYNEGTLTVIDCTFSDNSAERLGGAIYSTGVLTVTRCTFADNAATAGGGGIVSFGALTVVDSTFIGNTGSEAGAINSQGVLTVSGSTFSGNSAMTGGAIFSISTAMVTNSTFYSNTAEALGGGIAANSECALTVSHCTFSGNTAGYFPEDFGRGGGAIAVMGVLTYTHTIMAGSVNGDCRLLEGGTVESRIANLVEDGSCFADLSRDPLLGPLADHGGPTHTMALLPGSPALNAGDASTCPAATDQRGVARPQGVGCDLGAYEQELPSASTEAASDVTPTCATLQGVVNAHHGATTVTFAYGLDTGYGLTATVPSAVTGAADTAVSAILTDLAPATTYHYRVVAENGAGVASGADRTLTTAAVAPSAVTEDATDVTETGATLQGTVNANNSSATVAFEYGLTAGYGMTATVPSVVTGTVDVPVSAALSGLTPNETYHYRVVAENAAGLAYGADRTLFTTAPPTATTLAAEEVTATGATLRGMVNARTSATTVTFAYGVDTSYPLSVMVPSAVTGAADTAVSAVLTGLTPNTTYHYRVVAVSAGGTGYGVDATFTTLPPPGRPLYLPAIRR